MIERQFSELLYCFVFLCIFNIHFVLVEEKMSYFLISYLKIFYYYILYNLVTTKLKFLKGYVDEMGSAIGDYRCFFQIIIFLTYRHIYTHTHTERKFTSLNLHNRTPNDIANSFKSAIDKSMIDLLLWFSVLFKQRDCIYICKRPDSTVPSLRKISLFITFFIFYLFNFSFF